MQTDIHPRPLMITGDRRTVFALELAPAEKDTRQTRRWCGDVGVRWGRLLLGWNYRTSRPP